MKYQFEVWSARGNDLVGTFFECDDYRIMPSAADKSMVFQVVDGDQVTSTYWFEHVLDYQWHLSTESVDAATG